MKRREFIKDAAQTVTALVLLESTDLAQAGKINSAEMVDMPDHNMPTGFVRYKINLDAGEGRGKVEGAGSFFSMESGAAKADFISAKLHPEPFQKGVDFKAVATYLQKQRKKPVIIVAGAYLANRGNDGQKVIDGFALDRGTRVGKGKPNQNLNGLVVVDKGDLQIHYLNEIPDFGQFVADLQKKRADMSQQTSVIRPGGKFMQTNNQKYELRFLVHGTRQGREKKGILNFSLPMTHTEAVAAMQKMKDFQIHKAIGLDTGIMSEGYFYDAGGKDHLMIDGKYGVNRDKFTNVLALYSQG